MTVDAIETMLDLRRTGGLLASTPVLSAPPRISDGTMVGAYRIAGMLGRGGTAEVYAAERTDRISVHRVAIKVARSEVDGLDRFQVEQEILGRLGHPQIAALYDSGVTADRRPYLVMEFVPGKPITHWCKDRRASLQQRLLLFKQLCAGLIAAHRNRVVHGDLKPGNILVTHHGQVKLIDFGAAQLLDRPPDQPRLGYLTPNYAAPEQLRGDAVSIASDLYALGILLFELTTGANPRASETLPLALLVNRVLSISALPRKFARHNSLVKSPVLADAIEAIVVRATQYAPERRYQSVLALQADIARLPGRPPRVARMSDSTGCRC